MKKTITLLMIAALLFSASFGCNAAKEAEAAPTAEPTAVPTAEPVDPLSEIAEAEIFAGRHAREEGYPNPFQTHGIDTPFANVQLMDGEAYSDERLRTLAATVASDVVAIGAGTGEAPEKVTVYIVWNLLQDRPVLLGDHMICSAEQVESGAYREALCGVCYDLPIPWKQVGLYELMFGAPDGGGLKEYYADEAHALTASCAAVYFLPEVAGEETAAAARQTAASMTRQVLQTGGLDELRTVVSTEALLREWTAALGIETPIALPDGHERAAGMVAYRDRTPRRVCVLEIENFTVRLNEGGPAGTADELYTFACQMLNGLDFELQMIREASPSFAETADRRAKESIVITLSDDPTQSGVSTGSQYEINLVNRNAVWHELIHALLWTNGTNMLAWMQEGLAEHYSRSAVSMAIAEPEWKSFADWFPDSTEMNEEELAFWTAVFRVYVTVRGEDEAVPSEWYDDWAYRRALAICELFLPYDPYEGHKNASVGGVRGERADAQATDGNALSYEEAMVMLEYLFDVYGTDTIADCMMNNKTLSETCGKDYPALYADCIAYLTETYGSLLAD